MKLEDLKLQIEHGKVPPNLLIFKCPTSTFIAEQYTREISKLLNYSINRTTLDDVVSQRTGPFYIPLPELDVITCDSLDFIKDYNILDNVIIITKSVADVINESYVVNIPELKPWMIKDYLYSNLENAEKEDLEFLASVLTDVYKVDSELQRYAGFNPAEQPRIISKAILDGLYNDLINFELTDLGNALKARDIQKVHDILKHNPVKTDKDLFGLLGLLRSGFKSVWSVRLTSTIMRKLKAGMFVTDVDSAVIGMEGKKVFAISKSDGFMAYTTKQLTNILMFLNTLNKKLVTGALPDSMEQKLDYVLVNILAPDDK